VVLTAAISSTACFGRRVIRHSPSIGRPSPEQRTRFSLGLLLFTIALLGFMTVRPAKADEPTWDGRAVVYPTDNQKEIPLALFGEWPDPTPERHGTEPVGYPITITFQPGVTIKDAKCRVSIGDGEEVEGWFSSPENPANPKFAAYQGSTLCFIAKTKLKPSETYHVSAEAVVNGECWAKEWNFTTAHRIARDATAAQAQFKNSDGTKPALEDENEALRAVNTYRRCVGLDEVVLDADLCRGCALHAQYLFKNSGRPELDGAKGHTEDESLPGYSEEGKRTGLASVIAFQTIDPTASVELWMTTFYHRVPILDPNLKRIGFGSAKSEFGALMVAVMDVGTGVQSQEDAEREWWPAATAKSWIGPEGRSEAKLERPAPPAWRPRPGPAVEPRLPNGGDKALLQPLNQPQGD